MESSAESIAHIDDEDVASISSKKRLADKYNYHFSVLNRWLSTKYHIFSTLAFLVGSIAFIIISEVVRAKRIPLDQTSSDINPSCTDFGSSAAEQKLSLDLTYGNFTFTQAKVIDATWDTVIGQGGRLLHGWILYRCVLYPLLVLAMEISTVAYPYYVTLSFSKASVETLLELLKTLHLTKSYSILLCTILLIYTLAYTLLFSLIWGTATGYVSLSHKLYAMPGDEIVPLNSENLSPCWVLDPMRLGLSTPHVEVGPNFSAILSHSQRASSRQKNDSCLSSDQRAYDLQYGSSGWRVKSAESTLWDFLAVAEEKSSENFMSIQRYALARQFLQIGLDTRGWVDSGWETTLNRTTSFEADGTMTLNRRNTSDAPVTLDWSSNTTSKCKDYSLYGLYSKVRAVTLEEPLTQEEIANIYPYNKSAPGIAYWSLFVLNESIQLGPGVVPYNSTIRLDDSLIPLEAPFLDVGFNCSAYPKSNSFNGLGNCVCYKGKPISLDLLSDDKAICNTAPGYVWGFSSYLTRMGLILEATWMLCCFVAYPWLLYRSKLLHMEPIKSSKTIRLLLDCSEAVNNDMGPDVKYLREDEIVQRLKNIKIGYNTDACEGNLRNRIVSGLASKGFSERLHEAHDRLPSIIYEMETGIFKRAQAFDTTLNKTLPLLNRVANSPAHDAMNKRVKRGIAGWRSYFTSGKRRPTANEIYEDVRWRF